MAKRAYIVGINDYRNWHAAGFPDLHFCRPDAVAFAERVLRDGLGFPAGNITVCEDAEATRLGILTGIERMLDACDLGDVACFYFSGHGDRNPLRSDTSRWYEAIVPYDGSAMVSDAEINRIVERLEMSRINFNIILDSCHSGGVYDPGVPDGIKAGRWTAEKAERLIATCRGIVPVVCASDTSKFVGNVRALARTAERVDMQVADAMDFSDTAKATLIAACEYDEVAQENGMLGHGYLTSAFIEIVNQSNFQLPYGLLLTQLRKAVSGYATRFGTGPQTPQERGRPIRLEENFLNEWTFSI